MMKPTHPKSACLRQRAGLAADARNAAADEYGEEFDEIESLSFDGEHDEDDRDPEPERRPYEEHAQARPSARRRLSVREDKSWI